MSVIIIISTISDKNHISVTVITATNNYFTINYRKNFSSNCRSCMGYPVKTSMAERNIYTTPYSKTEWFWFLNRTTHRDTITAKVFLESSRIIIVTATNILILTFIFAKEVWRIIDHFYITIFSDTLTGRIGAIRKWGFTYVWVEVT